MRLPLQVPLKPKVGLRPADPGKGLEAGKPAAVLCVNGRLSTVGILQTPATIGESAPTISKTQYDIRKNLVECSALPLDARAAKQVCKIAAARTAGMHWLW